MNLEKLTIRGLRARAVNAPMPRPLVTSNGTIAIAPLVLLDLETDQGISGCSYVFPVAQMAGPPIRDLLRSMEPWVKGALVAPVSLDARLRARCMLVGHQGLIDMALSCIDMACWDALAKAAGLPLARLLGGEIEPIRAYNSNGLGLMEPQQVADQAEELLAEGFDAIKIRLGRPTLEADLAAVRALRARVPESVTLMADFNQGLSVTEAIRRGLALQVEGLYWIEEPVRADDYVGSAKVAQALRIPVQIGENFWGPQDMADAIAAEASDWVMPDAGRIGGVTGWLRAAALAHARGIEMSSHLFPEVSAHLLAVTPTRHYLEYVDWATPILREPLQVYDGHVHMSGQPGTGIAWDEAVVSRYLV